MGYVLKAVLSSAQHPEYGQITVPFPIPDEKYDRMIELLEPLEIGDALRQDCRVDELDSWLAHWSILMSWTIWPNGWTVLMTVRLPSSREWPANWASQI